MFFILNVGVLIPDYSAVAVSAVSGQVLWRKVMSESVMYIQCGLRNSTQSSTVCLLIGKSILMAVNGTTGREKYNLWKNSSDKSFGFSYFISLCGDWSFWMLESADCEIRRSSDYTSSFTLQGRDCGWSRWRTSSLRQFYSPTSRATPFQTYSSLLCLLMR